jgi:hypothetical protein
MWKSLYLGRVSVEQEKLELLLKERFGEVPTVPLEEFSEDIRMVYDVRYYYDSKSSYIITDKTLDYPIMQGFSDATVDRIRNLSPEDDYTLLQRGDLVLDLTDADRMTLILAEGCSRCYADAGMSIITPKDISHSVFIYWYLTIDEVSAYIDVDPVDRIRKVPVPVSDYLISKEFTKTILDTMMVESSVLRNAKEITKRLKMIRSEMLYDIKDKVAACQ